MPTYEYACKECGQHLEVQQSFTDASLTECPNCHGPLRKVFGNIAITFKGSGFYKTDSRTATSAAAKSSEKSSEKGSDTAAATSDKAGSESSKPADTKSGSAAKTEKPAKAPEAKAS